MKLIFALLLFASVSVGQEKLESPSWIVPGTMVRADSCGRYSDDELKIAEIVYDRWKWVQNFLHQYSRYEKECYADSTATNGAIIRPWGQGEFWIPNYRKDSFAIDISFVRWEVRWTHREPTFPGFIQYMKGKR